MRKQKTHKSATRFLKKFARSTEGTVAVVVAMLLPLMIGLAGVGVDVSRWTQQQRKLQSAADAAALAGAFELANGRSQAYAEDAALDEAVKNGYVSVVGNSLDVNFSTVGVNRNVEVIINQNAEVWFSSLFIGDQDATVYTAATAQVEGVDGPYCFLTLNTSTDHAVSISGNVTVDAASCGIADNSSSDSALYLNGNVFVNVGDVKIVGDYVTSGGSYDFSYESMRTEGSSTADPYSTLGIPTGSYNSYNKQGSNMVALGSQTSCTAAQIGQPVVFNDNSGTIHIQPGRYCGGLSISGNASYVVDQVNDASGNPIPLIMEGGDFSVSGNQGTITVNGTPIILTNGGSTTYGNFNVTGGRDLYFKAPTTGPYAGISVYQDRNASTTGSNSLNGNAGMSLDGVFYSPRRAVNFGGTAKSTNDPNSTTCSKIIADTIVFHGTPHIGNNCTGKNTKAIGTPNVTLIL